MNENKQPNHSTQKDLPAIPPYLEDVRKYLKTHERKLWDWFNDEKQRKFRHDSVKLDLRKSTVRIDTSTGGGLYAAAEQAAEQLGIDVPITIYQATQSAAAGQLNASISIETDEANIVMHGDLSECLSERELLALFGHELSHLKLWQEDDGEILASGIMLMALSSDPSANAVHQQTLRWFNQFTEVYCDRGAMIAVEDFEPVVASLIKLETAVKQVNASSYLQQANEIFADDFRQEGSTAITHPELYIRTRALDLYANHAEDFEVSIARMIQGRLSLDRMDLTQQDLAQQLTRQLLDVVLEPDWMQCESTLAHAKLFFEDYRVRKPHRGNLIKAATDFDDDFVSYFCYAMLDFVTAERDIQEAALGYLIPLASDFGCEERFVESAYKEMRLTKTRLKKIIASSKDLADQAATLKKSRVAAKPKSAESEIEESRKQESDTP